MASIGPRKCCKMAVLFLVVRDLDHTIEPNLSRLSSIKDALGSIRVEDIEILVKKISEESDSFQLTN